MTREGGQVRSGEQPQGRGAAVNNHKRVVHEVVRDHVQVWLCKGGIATALGGVVGYVKTVAPFEGEGEGNGVDSAGVRGGVKREKLVWGWGIGKTNYVTLQVAAAWMLELTSKAMLLMRASLINVILKAEQLLLLRSLCHWRYMQDAYSRAILLPFSL